MVAMPDWRELESDFRNIMDHFGQMRADWSYRPGEPEMWRLAAWPDSNTRQRFEALAHMGARMLNSSSAARSMCPTELLKEPNHLYRWFNAIKELTGSFRDGPTGIDYDEKNKPVGKLYTGSIDNVVEASCLLCLKLAVEEDFPVQLESIENGGRISATSGHRASATEDKLEQQRGQKSRLDRWVDRAKDHPKLALLLLAALVLVGLGSVTDSLDKVILFGKKYILRSETRSEITNSRPKTVTIRNGQIELSGSGFYLIATEDGAEGAESDDLTKIKGLSFGDEATLSSASEARTIVLRKGPYLRLQADFSLNNKHDLIVVKGAGEGICSEVSRASND